MYFIGIIGIGVLGTAILETFISIKTIDIKCYDKYKLHSNSLSNSHNTNLYVSKIEELCHCNIIFICLPTDYDIIKK